MWLLIPFLAIGALPNVWVTDHTCGTEAMVGTLRVLRPALLVNTKEGHARDWALSLQKKQGSYLVRLKGGNVSLSRSFDDPGDCDAAGRTAALIVDGSLDELSVQTSSASLEPLVPSKPKSPLTLSPVIGLGGRQSLLGGVLTVTGGLALEAGLFESRLEAEYVVPNSKRLLEAEPGTGSFVASGITPILAEGITFPAGPGKAAIDVEVGIELTFLAVKAANLFRQQPQTIVEPFGGLRFGYSVPLPGQFFVAGQLEERAAPALARFQVEGLPTHVTTRTWTLAGGLSVGRRFF
jgi:hypothetical protein